MTQGVTYESLPYAIRTVLHDQIGAYIERRYADSLTQYLPLLAITTTWPTTKPKRTYLRMAGEAAQADYANEAAIDYYRRVLPLLTTEEQIGVLLNLGDVLQLVGKWQEAGVLFTEALEKAVEIGDQERQGWSCVAMGELQRKHGQYAEAVQWLDRGRAIFEELDDPAGVGQVLHYVGTLCAQQGDYPSALQNYTESLEIRRTLDDKRNISSLLSNMGIVARFQGEYGRARALHEEALVIRRELGNKWAIANSLNNLGKCGARPGGLRNARRQPGRGGYATTSSRRPLGDRKFAQQPGQRRAHPG
ncbi:MAG: tetratricopeptide repeat protein [Caldilineaceae bacterium]|nr:tetratricopeptide repeat protein [Caldilineaceae bacterium]